MKLRAMAATATAALLGGCAGDFVHVRAGDDPQYQDDGVRFRATYYFRVYDHCKCTKEDMDAGKCMPKADSLYRFRMTGKAGLLTQVHFEAGTLRAYQIDPFGAAVVYDEGQKRFHFQSEPAQSPQPVPALIKASTPASACDPGESRRAFQVLGPEGLRTFDQDERLVLAMTTSGKPLIATMRELSERVLNEKAGSADLHVYLREQHAVARARAVLDAAKADDDLQQTWRQLSQALEGAK